MRGERQHVQERLQVFRSLRESGLKFCMALKEAGVCNRTVARHLGLPKRDRGRPRVQTVA